MQAGRSIVHKTIAHCSTPNPAQQDSSKHTRKLRLTHHPLPAAGRLAAAPTPSSPSAASSSGDSESLVTALTSSSSDSSSKVSFWLPLRPAKQAAPYGIGPVNNLRSSLHPSSIKTTDETIF